MLINLVVGDWSNDGHGKTATFAYNVTGVSSTQEVIDAHKVGCEILGIELTQWGGFPYCQDYEDDSFPAEIAEKLNLSDYNETDEEMIGLFPESFAELYTKIVQVGNPGITFELLRGTEIDIGGYGLFN